jgi:formylglycine-generating enzyme required for sulfatase activity
MKYILSSLIITFCFIFLACCATTSKTDWKDKDGMIVVPSGLFNMGLDNGEPNERPEHETYLETFMIDKYEVSAKDFAEFLNEKGNSANEYFTPDSYSTIIVVSQNAAQGEKTKNPQTYLPRKGFEQFPANNVSWFGAYTYCQWKGKRLPTEAEWEKAARGDDKRVYPWGNSMPDAQKAQYNQDWDVKGFDVLVPVESLPDGSSYYNVYNMAGNVWEWVDDWYRQNYCRPCENTPLDEPAFGSFKVLRGGSWYDSHGELVIRSTYRYRMDPKDRYIHTGFRCAK